jgi:hypothetical protein
MFSKVLLGRIHNRYIPVYYKNVSQNVTTFWILLNFLHLVTLMLLFWFLLLLYRLFRLDFASGGLHIWPSLSDTQLLDRLGPQGVLERVSGPCFLPHSYSFPRSGWGCGRPRRSRLFLFFPWHFYFFIFFKHSLSPHRKEAVYRAVWWYTPLEDEKQDWNPSRNELLKKFCAQKYSENTHYPMVIRDFWILTIFPGDFGIRRYLGLWASNLGFESGFGDSIFPIF